MFLTRRTVTAISLALFFIMGLSLLRAPSAPETGEGSTFQGEKLSRKGDAAEKLLQPKAPEKKIVVKRRRPDESISEERARLDREQYELEKSDTSEKSMTEDEVEAVLARLGTQQRAFEEFKRGQVERLQTVEAKDASKEIELIHLSNGSDDGGVFSVEELEALARQGAEVERNGRRFNPGVRTGSAVQQEADLVEEEEPEPEPTPEEELLFRGQTRGYSLLSLMHPAARASTESQIQTMLESRVASLQLGVLVDGTFDQDFLYLQDVVRRLNTGERELTLTLYLSNGPTMRRFDTTPIRAGFAQVEPARFRELISFDRIVRGQFQEVVQQALPVFQLNRSLNPRNRNIAIVMLEDNLDAPSYRAMRDLASAVLGDVADFIRNPCPGCYRGNTAEGYGDPVEYHAKGPLPALSPGDAVSLDGAGFGFPNEANPKALPLEFVQQLMIDAATMRLSYFSLWRFERQGLRVGSEPRHPDDRNYEIPSVDQARLEVALLRSGLTEDTPGGEGGIEGDSEVVSGAAVQ